MGTTTNLTGKVVEYDEEQRYAYIDFKHNGKRVYLPSDQAEGLDLDDNTEVTFDIEMKGDKPYATNVKLK